MIRHSRPSRQEGRACDGVADAACARVARRWGIVAMASGGVGLEHAARRRIELAIKMPPLSAAKRSRHFEAELRALEGFTTSPSENESAAKHDTATPRCRACRPMMMLPRAARPRLLFIATTAMPFISPSPAWREKYFSDYFQLIMPRISRSDVGFPPIYHHMLISRVKRDISAEAGMPRQHTPRWHQTSDKSAD